MENLHQRAQALKELSPEFAELFETQRDIVMLQPEELQQLDKIYKEKCPNTAYDWKTTYHQWQCAQIIDAMNSEEPEPEPPVSTICPTKMYDPMQRTYRSPTIVHVRGPGGRRKKEDFNPHTFILRKRDLGEVYELSVRRQDEADYMDMVNEDRNDHLADQHLQKLVKLAAVMNANCNFKVVDLHSERRIR